MNKNHSNKRTKSRKSSTRKGTRKRLRKKGSATWVGKIPLGPSEYINAVTTVVDGQLVPLEHKLSNDYHDFNCTQDQTRQLWNKLLSYAFNCINRVKCNGSSMMKCIISGIPDKGSRGETWSAWYASEGFSQAHLEDKAKELIQFLEHVDSVEGQITAKLVYETCFKWLTHKGGKPHHKKQGSVNSIRSKQPQSSIRLKGNYVMFHGKMYPIQWDDTDQYHQHIKALTDTGKYLRASINDYKLKGTTYYRLLVTVDGKPPKKLPEIKAGVLGIDPSLKSSVVIRQDGTEGAIVCYKKNEAEGQVRQARKMYSRRSKLANPTYFDGVTPKSKRAKWVLTQGMIQALNAITEAHRVATAQQEQSIASIFKFLCTIGNEWCVEKHGTKGWQQGWFGRNSQLYAPGKILAGVIGKAENAGITIREVPARKAKLSQSCITTELAHKKPLSQRYHELTFEGKVEQQSRDLWSAWLATLWTGDSLNRDKGLLLYRTVGPRMLAINESLYQQATKTDHLVKSLLCQIAVESLAKDAFNGPKVTLFQQWN